MDEKAHIRPTVFLHARSAIWGQTPSTRPMFCMCYVCSLYCIQGQCTDLGQGQYLLVQDMLGKANVRSKGMYDSVWEVQADWTSQARLLCNFGSWVFALFLESGLFAKAIDCRVHPTGCSKAYGTILDGEAQLQSSIFHS